MKHDDESVGPNITSTVCPSETPSAQNFNSMFPKLAKVAVVILSLLVSNAWPERGATAIKRIKTRLWNRIKNAMLESLMQVTINRPDVKEARTIIDESVESWYMAKQRRKLRAPQSHRMR